MNLQSIWSALEESQDILGDYAYPAMDKAAEELSLPLDYFTWVAAVWLFSSESFTAAQFMPAFPYGLSQVNEERFASAVRQGYLASDGRGDYRATESGMPEPPSHFILTRKKELYLRMGMVALLEGFVAHCLELEEHRDDVYITTWQAYELEGHTWDVIDLLSGGEALTFDNLHKKLSRSGVTEEVHAEDVKELIGRGWVDEDSGKIQITSAGKQGRAEVEAETERLFFAPWSCLNESELEELSNLSKQLRDGLQDANRHE